MRIKTLVILIILLIASNLSSYWWPVEPQDKQHGINATLGEWRVGHFHAGVDINESLDSIYCPATSIVDTTELKHNWIGKFRYIHVKKKIITILSCLDQTLSKEYHTLYITEDDRYSFYLLK